MSLYVDEDELEGKTIEQVVLEKDSKGAVERILFLFTDGTYSGLGIGEGYYEPSDRITFTEPAPHSRFWKTVEEVRNWFARQRKQ